MGISNWHLNETEKPQMGDWGMRACFLQLGNNKERAVISKLQWFWLAVEGVWTVNAPTVLSNLEQDDQFVIAWAYVEEE